MAINVNKEFHSIRAVELCALGIRNGVSGWMDDDDANDDDGDGDATTVNDVAQTEESFLLHSRPCSGPRHSCKSYIMA